MKKNNAHIWLEACIETLSPRSSFRKVRVELCQHIGGGTLRVCVFVRMYVAVRVCRTVLRYGLIRQYRYGDWLPF